MIRKSCWLTLLTIGLTSHFCSAAPEVRVRSESSGDATHFQFDAIQPPAIDDFGAGAKWVVVRGTADSNAASVSVLNDGKIPDSDDAPGSNFFFEAGTKGGALAVDLGKPTDVAEIDIYSWHAGSRAAHNGRVFGAADSSDAFAWKSLAADQKPIDAGWKQIAEFDARNRRRTGGQHATQIKDSAGAIGSYRYLLFEFDSNDESDPFGNSFLSEIDILSKQDVAPKRVASPDTQTFEFKTEDGKYNFIVDTTAAPELADWSKEKLKPVILEWYPKIVAMLPSDDFTPPETVRFRYLPSAKMEGIPAYAQGNTISLNAGWMIREKNREARGATVHEMVHIVQSYQSRRPRGQRRTPTPGWIVEGIPDYIRWFLYEPESKGALLSKEALAKAKHDASYRTSGNFIDWVARTYGKEGTFLQKLNAAAREGRYSTDTWKELTGKTEEELATEWRSQ